MKVNKETQYTIAMNEKELGYMRDILDFTIQDTGNNYWIEVATEFLYATGGVKNEQIGKY